MRTPMAQGLQRVRAKSGLRRTQFLAQDHAAVILALKLHGRDTTIAAHCIEAHKMLRRLRRMQGQFLIAAHACPVFRTIEHGPAETCALKVGSHRKLVYAGDIGTLMPKAFRDKTGCAVVRVKRYGPDKASVTSGDVAITASDAFPRKAA